MEQKNNDERMTKEQFEKYMDYEAEIRNLDSRAKLLDRLSFISMGLSILLIFVFTITKTGGIQPYLCVIPLAFAGIFSMLMATKLSHKALMVNAEQLAYMFSLVGVADDK